MPAPTSSPPTRFNANRISQADYGAEASGPRDQRRGGADHPRGRRRASRRRQPRLVAGALGPTNKTLSLSPDVNDPGYREVDFDLVSDVYVEQIEALVEGGVDFVLIETVFDTLNAKAAIHAARAASIRELPIMLSMTITDLSGRNLSGHSIESFWASVRHARPLTIGLNCSFGAAQLRPHIAALSQIADTLIMAYPNAGLPNDLGEYDECAETTAAPGPRMGRAGHRQHRRRLLRHDAGAYPRDRRDGEGLSAAQAARTAAADPARRHRADDPRRLVPARHPGLDPGSTSQLGKVDAGSGPA